MRINLRNIYCGNLLPQEYKGKFQFFCTRSSESPQGLRSFCVIQNVCVCVCMQLKMLWIIFSITTINKPMLFVFIDKLVNNLYSVMAIESNSVGFSHLPYDYRFFFMYSFVLFIHKFLCILDNTKWSRLVSFATYTEITVLNSMSSFRETDYC